DTANPLFEKSARPFGFSMETWAEAYQRWAYSIPLATNPVQSPTASCDQNQYAPVYFLTNNHADAASCSVPRHKPIAITLASLVNDYPCPDPTFKPAAGQTLFDFLAQGAKQIQDEIVELTGTLDGKPLGDLMS